MHVATLFSTTVSSICSILGSILPCPNSKRVAIEQTSPIGVKVCKGLWTGSAITTCMCSPEQVTSSRVDRQLDYHWNHDPAVFTSRPLQSKTIPFGYHQRTNVPSLPSVHKLYTSAFLDIMAGLSDPMRFIKAEEFFAKSSNAKGPTSLISVQSSQSNDPKDPLRYAALLTFDQGSTCLFQFVMPQLWRLRFDPSAKAASDYSDANSYVLARASVP